MKTEDNHLSLMRISKLSAVAGAVLAVGILGLGSDALAQSAVAQHANPAAHAPGKPPAEHVLNLHGVVVSLEGNTLTVGTAENHQKVQKKLTLAPDVAITLASDKKHETHAGQRSDIVPGIGVALTLSADGTTVRAIQVMGRTLHGGIAAVDAASLTIASKTKDGPREEKFTLTPATVIVLSHGTDKGAAHTGNVADLKVGMPVAVTLSAVDKTTVREVVVQPMSPHPKPGK
jgi:hypothetical protein